MRAPRSADEAQTQTEFFGISLWAEFLPRPTFANEIIMELSF